MHCLAEVVRMASNQRVGSSNLSGRASSLWVQPGDMGDTTYLTHRLLFWSEGIFQRFKQPRLQIEVSQIIIHKAQQPDIVVDFFDADRLAGKDLAEINFLATQTDAPASGDHDRFIVEGIVAVRQAGVGAR